MLVDGNEKGWKACLDIEGGEGEGGEGQRKFTERQKVLGSQ